MRTALPLRTLTVVIRPLSTRLLAVRLIAIDNAASRALLLETDMRRT